MSRLIRTLFLISLLSYMSNTCFSQLSISYYSSSLSKIGLGYNFTERFWSELRLYSNTSIENITTEFVLCYNIVKKDKHNVYFGLGGVVNYFNGFVIPVGIQFTPFEKLDRFSFHIEIQPTLDIEGNLIIQAAWGLRYKFGKKNE
jgi:hypothetical protein